MVTPNREPLDEIYDKLRCNLYKSDKPNEKSWLGKFILFPQTISHQPSALTAIGFFA